ncbi:Phospholipase A1 [Pseudolycoriella hygida]|uniref:Phospholipase A1 n=1 Tax=Pseudolycoriella hygida TaxID=35572 RepID=A0A9Q0N310_9DIPT|nr:Phospholipase A1 [Pseudolycoriella hygida]
MCKLTLLLVLVSIHAALSSYQNAKIYFYFQNSNGVTSNVVYDLDNAVSVNSHPKYDSTKPTMLYSHGYIESVESDTVQAIVKAYITNGRYNILAVDWRQLAAGIYPIVAAQLAILGEEVAKQILLMGVIERLHFVGHSLGGQLGGYIGKAIISQSKGSKKLKRISALDPAGPDFYLVNLFTSRLTAADAEFVDVIHTDGGVLGYPVNTGTVDFYPNGGRRSQPGCIFLVDFLCSHQRSVYLWAESVEKGDTVSFISTSPSGSPNIQMGNNCPLSATGTYYLATAKRYPYSLS